MEGLVAAQSKGKSPLTKNGAIADSDVLSFREKQLLDSASWSNESLFRQYPPIWDDGNKALLYSLHTPQDTPFEKLSYTGDVRYTRWSSEGIVFPRVLSSNLVKVTVVDNAFDYQADTSSKIHWYMNFAHFNLFTAYSGGLFAQDEMQVAEIPALGSVREVLRDMLPRNSDSPLVPRTRTMDSEPTPITIRGAQRRVMVATDRNAREGRPVGLYGNAFCRADENAIKKATTILNPPVSTNILAMEAPAGGHGPYRRATIMDVLTSCFAGYLAIRAESTPSSADSSASQVAIHTGHWGCGAYGGNKELMAILQIIAAHLTGVNEVVYHTFGINEPVRKAMTMVDEILARNLTIHELIDHLEAKQFMWGVSDGN